MQITNFKIDYIFPIKKSMCDEEPILINMLDSCLEDVLEEVCQYLKREEKTLAVKLVKEYNNINEDKTKLYELLYDRSTKDKKDKENSKDAKDVLKDIIQKRLKNETKYKRERDKKDEAKSWEDLLCWVGESLRDRYLDRVLLGK